MPSMPQRTNASNAPSVFIPGRVRMVIACACVGLSLVYVAGFSQMEAVHNGAHDARHAAALPCH